jgi:hypothetical protein
MVGQRPVGTAGPTYIVPTLSTNPEYPSALIRKYRVTIIIRQLYIVRIEMALKESLREEG